MTNEYLERNVEHVGVLRELTGLKYLASNSNQLCGTNI